MKHLSLKICSKKNSQFSNFASTIFAMGYFFMNIIGVKFSALSELWISKCYRYETLHKHKPTKGVSDDAMMFLASNDRKLLLCVFGEV